jgi:hypothetical protein
MNISQIKLVAWLAAGLLTLGLSAYVVLFIQRLPELEAPLDTNEIRAALEDVPPVEAKTDELIAYDDVKRLFHETGLNWTGKQAVVEAPVTAIDTGPKAPPKVPVTDLLKVLMLQVDPVDASQSVAFVKYLPKAQVPPMKIGGIGLRVGDRLLEPHDHVRVESIAIDGVTFAFDDEARDKETLAPPELDTESLIVAVGPDGIATSIRSNIPKGAQRPRETAKQTFEYQPNKFRIGTEDAANFEQNYSRILTEEVAHQRHRDPRTGRYDGVELTEVRPGGTAEKHGAQSGDIIKSINGHPVTSVPEAINYAKVNAGKYAKWDVVIERKGREMTITYDSPPTP